MSDSDAVIAVETQIEQCRLRWTPIIEDSIGVTYGSYRSHDEHCTRCKPLLSLLKEVSEERRLKREALDKFADYCIERNRVLELLAEKEPHA